MEGQSGPSGQRVCNNSNCYLQMDCVFVKFVPVDLLAHGVGRDMFVEYCTVVGMGGKAVA